MPIKPFTEELKYEWALTPESIVIDGGSHEGNWAFEIWKRYQCRMICVEPIPRYIYKTFEKLYYTANATIVPMALGRHNTATIFHVHGAMSGAFIEGPEQIVGVLDVGLLLNRIGGQVALLKLNIEGGEFDVLEHILAEGLVPRIDNILVQPHTVVPDYEKRWKAIQDGLSETHECIWGEPWCWEAYKLK